MKISQTSIFGRTAALAAGIFLLAALPATAATIGDPTDDGNIATDDAVQAMGYAVESTPPPGAETATYVVTNVDCDDAITPADALLILRKAAGFMPTLQAENANWDSMTWSCALWK